MPNVHNYPHFLCLYAFQLTPKCKTEIRDLPQTFSGKKSWSRAVSISSRFPCQETARFRLVLPITYAYSKHRSLSEYNTAFLVPCFYCPSDLELFKCLYHFAAWLLDSIVLRLSNYPSFFCIFSDSGLCFCIFSVGSLQIPLYSNQC